MSNYKILQRPYPRVDLHPATIQHIKKGHPWVTLDTFSKKFPRERTFLVGKTKGEEELAVLIHDPTHPNVRARVWSIGGDLLDSIKNFPEELQSRLDAAIIKRKNMDLFSQRENVYLCFGESDSIPGLLIQVLGDRILIQYYAGFWKNLEHFLVNALSHSLKDNLPELNITTFWVQERNLTQSKNTRKIPVKGYRKSTNEREYNISEFGVNYKIRIDENYDQGLYTDMAGIRKSIEGLIPEKASVLNLYSYTGAYSLFALKSGAENVVSVDLSGKYLEWLDENIELNSDINSDNHTSMCMPVNKAIAKLTSEEASFDLIINDPPSASSDGKKVTNAFRTYEEILAPMLNLLKPGGKAFIFLNTHNISWPKFEGQITKIMTEKKLKKNFFIEKRLKLTEDCVTLPTFREGDYLKGFIIKRKEKK